MPTYTPKQKQGPETTKATLVSLGGLVLHPFDRGSDSGHPVVPSWRRFAKSESSDPAITRAHHTVFGAMAGYMCEGLMLRDLEDMTTR